MSEVRSMPINGVIGTLTVNYLYNNTDFCCVIFDIRSKMLKTHSSVTLESLP